MESLMDLQTTCSRVAFGASRIRADEWFFSSMRQFMSLQVSLGDELLVAL